MTIDSIIIEVGFQTCQVVESVSPIFAQQLCGRTVAEVQGNVWNVGALTCVLGLAAVISAFGSLNTMNKKS